MNHVHVKETFDNESDCNCFLVCYQLAARSVRVLNAWVEDNCETIWGAYSDNTVRVWDGGEGNTNYLFHLIGYHNSISTT